jgi:hypothetical protein
MPLCPHLDAVGYDEFECRLTWNAVEADCASLTEGYCIPRLALRYLMGTLRHFERMDTMTQGAIRMTAQQMQKDGRQPPAGADSGTAIPLTALNDPAGIDRAIKALRKRKQLIASAHKILDRLRDRLQARRIERDDLDKAIRADAEVIRQIEEGELPANLDQIAKGLKRRGGVWTAERRAKMSARKRAADAALSPDAAEQRRKRNREWGAEMRIRKLAKIEAARAATGAPPA